LGHEKKPEVEGKNRVKGSAFQREFALFLVLFFVIWLLSYLLTRRFPGFVDWGQVVVAREVAFFLKIFGYNYTQTGGSIVFFTPHGGENLQIIPECTGLYTSIIYFSIIGAYPARIGEKLAGLLIGLPAIHVLNLIRMVFIAWILYVRHDLFELFHGYLWQAGFLIFMILLVIFWLGKIVKVKAPGGAR
jgi:exosortase/archaeosortase family protein